MKRKDILENYVYPFIPCSVGPKRYRRWMDEAMIKGFSGRIAINQWSIVTIIPTIGIYLGASITYGDINYKNWRQISQEREKTKSRELNINSQQHFGEADTNKDGVISEREFINHYQNHMRDYRVNEWPKGHEK